MSKKLSAFLICVGLFFGGALSAAVTRITGVSIINSQINSTPIGAVTPTTGAFTSVTLSSGNALSSTTGNSGVVQQAGSNSGTNGATLCNDANKNATTTCPVVQSTTFCPSGCEQTGTPCNTGSSSFNGCDNTVNWPTNFANTNYTVVCNGVGPHDPNNTDQGRVYLQTKSKTISSVTVTTVTLGNTNVNWLEIDCQARHR